VFGCNKLYSFEYHGIAKTVVFSEFLNSTLGLFFSKPWFCTSLGSKTKVSQFFFSKKTIVSILSIYLDVVALRNHSIKKLQF
jgi:hypothetical protein